MKNNRALSARPMTVPTASPSWLTVSMSKNSSEHEKKAPVLTEALFKMKKALHTQRHECCDKGKHHQVHHRQPDPYQVGQSL